ncbi:hypothetical protein FPOAC2_04374 [Fusarium poae]|uniref:hypothetical protein n=1 Tax=Fusarium poae TaxID=36050 RepID=UPI001CE77E31|nr:hypothetical protein FPOAC1_004294 [Fusarium poae]KAG8671057.1 hypothetical protein FPOAC1_004294 [Fusarium poae]
MIDTREFPKRTFLRDLDAIRHYYRSDSDMAEMKDLKMLKEWREQDYYMGEYLTQGLLNIEDKCCQVSMQQLINTGLFYLCPPLKSSEWNDWARWGKTVFRIRTSFYEPRPLEETQVEKAVSIAQHCKRETFIFPFAVMLLALQNRDAGDELLYREFRRKFTDEEMNIGDITYDLESHRMKELAQFERLMEYIMAKRAMLLGTSDPINHITDGIQSLSLNLGNPDTRHS